MAEASGFTMRGHGLDTSLSERIEEYVDVFAFLCDQLGVQLTEPRQP
jgi:hypothetical protein